MSRETERQYVDDNNDIDSSRRWNTEGGYISGLGDDTADMTTPVVDTSHNTWVDAFTQVLPAVASVYQQDQFNKANLALINAGKPPMTAAQYALMQPTTATVAVGPTADAKKWMVYGGIALLALVGLRAAKVI